MTNPLDSPVVEHVVLSVGEGRRAEFESAFEQAIPLVTVQPGFGGVRLLRITERAGIYVLIIGWASVEAHEAGFRRSAEFPRWRALLHHFYEVTPMVEHATVIASD